MKFQAALAIALVASTLALPMAADADDKGKNKNKNKSKHSKSDNGKHLGWYKNGKYAHAHKSNDCRDREHFYVWQGSNRYDGGRYENRYDSRYNSSYNTVYGNRYDSRYTSPAQQYDRRQQTKNEWRNIAYASGALAILGLLQKDNTLMFAGAAGALYSLNRYEQDRKSQNSLNRARARYFDYDHFYRDGVRFNRQVVTRNGQRYYQFVRAR